MIKTEITVFARFKETFGSKRTVELAGNEDSSSSVRDVLLKLCEETDKSYCVLFGDDGEILDNVLLMHNKKRISGEDAGSVMIKDGDEIVLYPPVSGG